MKTSKFYKLASKTLKKSDLKITVNNMEDSSDSKSDSDSDSDYSVKQEVSRSEPLEKPDRKMRTV